MRQYNYYTKIAFPFATVNSILCKENLKNRETPDDGLKINEIMCTIVFFLIKFSPTGGESMTVSRRHFLKTSFQAAAIGACFAGGSGQRLPWKAALAEEKGQAEKRAKWTCSSVNYSTLSLEDACKRISSRGYEAIDIWDSIEGYLTCPHLQSIAEQYHADGLAELLQKYKLDLCGFTVYMAKYPKYAELLGQCGGGIAIRGTRSRVTDRSITQDVKAFLEELKPELELCEKYDSYLAVENHSGDTLLNEIDSFKAFVDLNPHPRLGIALAPYHILHNKESVAEAIRLCKNRLLFIYLWINEPGEKQMPGVGSVDTASWFDALKEIRYSRFLTPFMHDHPAPDRMDELHCISLNYLKKQYYTANRQ